MNYWYLFILLILMVNYLETKQTWKDYENCFVQITPYSWNNSQIKEKNVWLHFFSVLLVIVSSSLLLVKLVIIHLSLSFNSSHDLCFNDYPTSLLLHGLYWSPVLLDSIHICIKLHACIWKSYIVCIDAIYFSYNWKTVWL